MVAALHSENLNHVFTPSIHLWLATACGGERGLDLKKSHKYCAPSSFNTSTLPPTFLIFLFFFRLFTSSRLTTTIDESRFSLPHFFSASPTPLPSPFSLASLRPPHLYPSTMAYGGGFGRSRGGYGDSNGYSNGYALHNDLSVLEPLPAPSTWAEALPLFPSAASHHSRLANNMQLELVSSGLPSSTLYEMTSVPQPL